MSWSIVRGVVECIKKFIILVKDNYIYNNIELHKGDTLRVSELNEKNNLIRGFSKDKNDIIEINLNLVKILVGFSKV